MKKTDKKSYYAVVPADVRYDNKLPAGAKLLYGEITALCNEQGFCWASNNYFAQLYKKEIKTISRWVAQLVEKGYIQSKINKADGNKRQLYLSPKTSVPMDKKVHTLSAKMSRPMDKKVHTLSAKMSRPMDKKVQHNNKDNTTLNTTDNKPKNSQGDLSSKDQQHYAVTLLRRYGVGVEVARAIVYDQHTPIESIENVIKNGLVKEERAKQTDGKFVLEAGYIVKALNKARREGKIVGPTELSKKLAAKLSVKRGEYSPLSSAEVQKRVRRLKSQAAAMIK